MLNVFLRISAFFKHLFKIFKHKYFVCKYCFKTGLYWRGIVHDLSKFHPKEFFESPQNPRLKEFLSKVL